MAHLLGKYLISTLDASYVEFVTALPKKAKNQEHMIAVKIIVAHLRAWSLMLLSTCFKGQLNPKSNIMFTLGMMTPPRNHIYGRKFPMTLKSNLRCHTHKTFFTFKALQTQIPRKIPRMLIPLSESDFLLGQMLWILRGTK